MKSYTDLEQSKVLSQILPHESADMWWNVDFTNYPSIEENIGFYQESKADIPCWTLAALLDIIPEGQVNRMTSNGKWMAVSWPPEHYYIAKDYDSAVDACYALILGLHKQNIL